MATLVRHLRDCLAAAEVREDRARRLRLQDPDAATEVSDGTHEEYLALERGWVDTVVPGQKSPRSAP
jgi:hypothetical protein